MMLKLNKKIQVPVFFGSWWLHINVYVLVRFLTIDIWNCISGADIQKQTWGIFDTLGRKNMKKIIKLIIKIDKCPSDRIWEMYPELTKHMKDKNEINHNNSFDVVYINNIWTNYW